MINALKISHCQYTAVIDTKI